MVPTVWEEGVEREVCTLNLSLHDLVPHPRRVEIDFAGQRVVAEVEQAAGPQADMRARENGAKVVLEQQPIKGAILLTAKRLDADLYRLCIQIENTTPGTGRSPVCTMLFCCTLPPPPTRFYRWSMARSSHYLIRPQHCFLRPRPVAIFLHGRAGGRRGGE